MIRHLCALAFILCFASLLRGADLAEEKYSNGQVKARYALVNGVRNGPYNLFFEDGKRQESGNYRNGELDGVRTLFHANGQLKERATYKLGKLDGPQAEFDDKNHQLKSAEYLQGKLNGVYREFQGTSATVERLYVGGQLIYPRSMNILRAELARIRAAKIETLKSENAIPKHPGENNSQQDREDAVRLLMEYRMIAGIPFANLKLDELYNAHAEAAVALLKDIGRLDHTPKNPGWPEDQYKFGYIGTSRSNLAMGRASNVRSVRMYMDDSDPSNIGAVGHRRWCLNPYMGKVGFAADGGFSAMMAHDGSRQDVGPWEFVAHPAAGLHPASHFSPSHAWSISLNTRKFKRPDKDVKVSVKPAAIDLKKGQITPTGDALSMNFFNVDSGGYGVGNCIIFRPERVSTQPGSIYLVEVRGLEDASGKPATLTYVVEFCKVE